MKITKRLAAVVTSLVLFIVGSGSVFAAQMADGTKEKPDVLVDYLIVEEPVVNVPEKQTVMLGIGDESTKLDSAVLSYSSQESGRVYEAEASEIYDNFVMFQMEFTKESQTGSYRLDGITYTADNRTYETSFEEMGIDAAFGVNQIVESEPDDVLLTDEEAEALAAGTEMNIVALNEEGQPLSGETMEEAMDQAGCSVKEGLSQIMRKGAKSGNAVSADPKGMRSQVVVLDPGPGGSDSGTAHNGVVEKDLTLKIAKYCKAELEEYAGITVYMTRNNDSYLTLAQRAQIAIAKRADLFVSLHNNYNPNPAPCGAGVYYPNSNYNANCGTSGKNLASIILTKLTDLGLANAGIRIRNSENGTKYPDGSLADFYGVIKRCKENGIPALIVEHAFVSNANDVKNYLSSDAQLKKLGIADATGIAEYYGLKKGLGFNSIQSASSTTMDLKWSMVVGVSGYCIYRSTTSGDGFVKVAQISSADTTTWKDTGLTPGTTYYYKIRTYNKTSSGTKYGKYSSVASGTTMSTPKISSVKSKDSKTLVISWATMNNAANYELYRSTKKDGTFKKIATIAGMNQLNYTDKVKAGKLYYYKIRSIGMIDNTTVYSDYSAPAPGRTAVIPKDVSVRSEGTETLRVSWTADPNMSGYVIKRATSAKGKYKKVGTVNGGSQKYYDDKVKTGKTYYYKVQSFNHNDGIKGVSGYGKSAYGKTIQKTSITKITNNSSTSQTINWKKVKGMDGYLIYQSTSKNGVYKKIKKITGYKKNSYTVTGLTPGVRYYYKVRTRKKANGKMGYGSYSAARNTWTLNPVQITSAKGVSGNKIQIAWAAAGGAEYYDIYRCDSIDGAYQKIASVANTQTSYTDASLNMNQNYFYKIETSVKGYKTDSKTCGMSAASGASPINITGITSVAENEQEMLEIAWRGVPDVTGYQIYRSTEANGNYTLLQTISGAANTSYADLSAKRGVVYYYKVVVMNQYGSATIYGQHSPAVSGMLPETEQKPDMTPGAPTAAAELPEAALETVF